MQSKAKTVNEYIDYLPIERQIVLKKLRQVIKKNLPQGFKEEMSYGMIGYVVPHSIYPDGYHCNPKLPLPFLSIASQKYFITYYHMGIYSDKNILNWFNDEWKKISKSKLDMGKSCIRFKNIDKIPYELMGQLASKITPQEWIKTYENNIKR